MQREDCKCACERCVRYARVDRIFTALRRCPDCDGERVDATVFQRTIASDMLAEYGIAIRDAHAQRWDDVGNDLFATYSSLAQTYLHICDDMRVLGDTDWDAIVVQATVVPTSRVQSSLAKRTWRYMGMGDDKYVGAMRTFGALCRSLAGADIAALETRYGLGAGDVVKIYRYALVDPPMRIHAERMSQSATPAPRPNRT